MSRRPAALACILVTAAMVCALGLETAHAFRARDVIASLFATALAPPTARRVQDDAVLRSRFVTINAAALPMSAPADPTASTRPTVLLNLFDDTAFSAALDRVDPADGGFTWVGRLSGVELSSVTLASVHGVFAGSIVMPGAVYTIRYAGQSTYEVVQLDERKMKAEAEPVDADPQKSLALRDAGAPPAPAPASIATAPSKAPALTAGRKRTERFATAPAALAFRISTPWDGKILRLVTPAQTVRVAGVAGPWIASANRPWIRVLDGSGAGEGQFTVSVDTTMSPLRWDEDAAIVVTSQDEPRARVAIPVQIGTGSFEPGAPPMGVVDSVTGSSVTGDGGIVVSGWAIDDIGVSRVEIWRAGLRGRAARADADALPGSSAMLVGRATFVPGSRPDLESIFGSYPAVYRAGWGYRLEPSGNWNAGDGTYTFYAVAFDVARQRASLGSWTVTVKGSLVETRFDRAGAAPIPPWWSESAGRDTVDPRDPLERGTKPRFDQLFQDPVIRTSVEEMLTVGRREIEANTEAPANAGPPFEGPLQVWNDKSGWVPCRATDAGVVVVETTPDRMMAVHLAEADPVASAVAIGSGGRRQPLPVGARWDAVSGEFWWRPLPGTLGTFTLLLPAADGSTAVVKVHVRPPE